MGSCMSICERLFHQPKHDERKGLAEDEHPTKGLDSSINKLKKPLLDSEHLGKDDIQMDLLSSQTMNKESKDPIKDMGVMSERQRELNGYNREVDQYNKQQATSYVGSQSKISRIQTVVPPLISKQKEIPVSKDDTDKGQRILQGQTQSIEGQQLASSSNPKENNAKDGKQGTSALTGCDALVAFSSISTQEKTKCEEEEEEETVKESKAFDRGKGSKSAFLKPQVNLSEKKSNGQENTAVFLKSEKFKGSSGGGYYISDQQNEILLEEAGDFSWKKCNRQSENIAQSNTPEKQIDSEINNFGDEDEEEDEGMRKLKLEKLKEIRNSFSQMSFSRAFSNQNRHQFSNHTRHLGIPHPISQPSLYHEVNSKACWPLTQPQSVNMNLNQLGDEIDFSLFLSDSQKNSIFYSNNPMMYKDSKFILDESIIHPIKSYGGVGTGIGGISAEGPDSDSSSKKEEELIDYLKKQQSTQDLINMLQFGGSSSTLKAENGEKKMSKLKDELQMNDKGQEEQQNNGDHKSNNGDLVSKSNNGDLVNKSILLAAKQEELNQEKQVNINFDEEKQKQREFSFCENDKISWNITKFEPLAKEIASLPGEIQPYVKEKVSHSEKIETYSKQIETHPKEIETHPNDTTRVETHPNKIETSPIFLKKIDSHPQEIEEIITHLESAQLRPKKIESPPNEIKTNQKDVSEVQEHQLMMESTFREVQDNVFPEDGANLGLRDSISIVVQDPRNVMTDKFVFSINSFTKSMQEDRPSPQSSSLNSSVINDNKNSSMNRNNKSRRSLLENTNRVVMQRRSLIVHPQNQSSNITPVTHEERKISNIVEQEQEEESGSQIRNTNKSSRQTQSSLEQNSQLFLEEMRNLKLNQTSEKTSKQDEEQQSYSQHIQSYSEEKASSIVQTNRSMNTTPVSQRNCGKETSDEEANEFAVIFRTKFSGRDSFRSFSNGGCRKGSEDNSPTTNAPKKMPSQFSMRHSSSLGYQSFHSIPENYIGNSSIQSETQFHSCLTSQRGSMWEPKVMNQENVQQRSVGFNASQEINYYRKGSTLQRGQQDYDSYEMKIIESQDIQNKSLMEDPQQYMQWMKSLEKSEPRELSSEAIYQFDIIKQETYQDFLYKLDQEYQENLELFDLIIQTPNSNIYFRSELGLDQERLFILTGEYVVNTSSFADFYNFKNCLDSQQKLNCYDSFIPLNDDLQNIVMYASCSAKQLASPCEFLFLKHFSFMQSSQLEFSSPVEQMCEIDISLNSEEIEQYIKHIKRTKNRGELFSGNTTTYLPETNQIRVEIMIENNLHSSISVESAKNMYTQMFTQYLSKLNQVFP